MATKTISLPNIPQGWYMAWNMYTQAGNQIIITLADSSATYVNRAARASSSFGSLSSGFQQVAGTGLTLTIEVPAAASIKTVLQPSAVPAPNGNTVGQGYVVLLEDATDDDYNDLYISIMAWRTRG